MGERDSAGYPLSVRMVSGHTDGLPYHIRFWGKPNTQRLAGDSHAGRPVETITDRQADGIQNSTRTVQLQLV
jgi:hypothetical protein